MTSSPRKHSWVAAASLSLTLALTSRAEATINHTTWLPMGPAPVSWYGGSSGRATAVAVNPSNVDDIWLGTAGGGVWHSTDGGKTWIPTSDDEQSLAIGSIALADCNPEGCSRVYAGTGENAIRRDTYYGRGLLEGFVFGGQVIWVLYTGWPYDFTYGSIYNVVIDPTTSYPNRVIYVTLSSGVTASASESTVTAPEPFGGYGIYKSTDDGITWQKLFVEGAEFDKPTDLEMDPFNSNHLWAGFLGKGIFETFNGGLSWCPLNYGVLGSWICKPCLGLPGPGTFDHVEIELSRSDGFLYATFGTCPDPLAASCSSFLYQLNAYNVNIFCGGYPVKSSDGCGGTYSRYTHALAADPFRTGTVFFGGDYHGLCRSTDYGKTWTQSGFLPPRGTLHPDHHAVVFTSSPNVLYETNDGGIAISTDSGNTWINRNNDLQTLAFQTIATSPLTTKVIGGMQDNSVAMWTGTRSWESKCCADGGFTVMDVDNKKYMYAVNSTGGPPPFYVDIAPMRSVDGGIKWEKARGSIPDTDARSFYPPLVQDPDPRPTTTQHALYFGTDVLWKSTDDAATWTDVSPYPGFIPEPEIVYGADVITAIAVDPTNPNHIYIGYYSGRTFWTTAACNNFACWSAALSGLLPGPVTWIAADPSDVNVAYATTSGFGPGIHVYRTPDGGRNWVKVPPSRPDLFGLPANTITVEPGGTDRPNRLWLGTDQGIYRSDSSGQSWYRFSNGLPNVPVYQIAIDPVHDRAIAATHGRGAYILAGPELEPSLGCAGNGLSGIDVHGNFFPPGQVCSMRILRKDATQCAPATSIDALGGTIHTNGKGELWRSDPNTNTYDAQQLVWACAAGKCLGGITLDKCNLKTNPIDTIEATCGTGAGIVRVSGCSVIDLPSAWLGLTAPAGGIPSSSPAACFDPEVAGGGIFQFLPTVQSGDGSSRLLCAVSVPFTSGDAAQTVLENARDAVNADAICQASGVSAEVVPAVLEVESEDIFPSPARLGLLAPDVTGGQLVPAWRYGPGQADGTCFSIDDLGVPVVDQLRPMRVRFATSPGGALGGTLTLKEHSDLGDCAMTVPTFPGETGAGIASALEAQFQSSGGSATTPDCPIAANPHDVLREGDSIVTTATSRIEICVNDPGIGASTAPREICFGDADCEDGNPCTLDTCDTATGRCQTAPAPDGLPCDDGDACTTGGTCIGGTCGTPVLCDDLDACTTDTCDPATGACLSTPVICDDLNPCTQDSCDAQTGQCVFSSNPGGACDDGNPCTTGDTCVSEPGAGASSCRGTETCADSDPCTVDLCDPATGACLSQPILCDDHNPCTIDSCMGGACNSAPVFGQTCDDGNRCTLGDTCASDPAGLPVCQGQAVNCDDGNTCTVDRCNPVTGGCDHASVPLSEVQDLLFTGDTSLTWSPTPGASFYNTYRGTIPSNLLGSRPLPPFDQMCFEMDDAHGDGLLVSIDGAIPPTGTAFYYNVTLVMPCGEGPIGRASDTRVIPNASPCGPAP